MQSLVLYLIGAAGAAGIITESTLMEPVRKWVWDHAPARYAQGIECHQCVGFWCGGLASLLTMPYHAWWCVPEFILYGSAGSLVSSLAANLMGYLAASTVFNLPDEKQA